MNKQNRTRPVKSIINPGRRFTTPIVPDWTIAVADRLVTEWAHLGPALHAAAMREGVARKARATIETINDGPRMLGWFYKAAPGTPQSLLRTGWHAVGEPCPRHVSDALLGELSAARDAYQAVAAPLWAAARAAGLSDTLVRAGQVDAGSVVRRVQYAGVSL